ncbi:MAG: hypothetical protein AAFO91_19365, partial [Bacteroidota bacterium]
PRELARWGKECDAPRAFLFTAQINRRPGEGTGPRLARRHGGYCNREKTRNNTALVDTKE